MYYIQNFKYITQKQLIEQIEDVSNGFLLKEEYKEHVSYSFILSDLFQTNLIDLVKNPIGSDSFLIQFVQLIESRLTTVLFDENLKEPIEIHNVYNPEVEKYVACIGLEFSLTGVFDKASYLSSRIHKSDSIKEVLTSGIEYRNAMYLSNLNLFVTDSITRDASLARLSTISDAEKAIYTQSATAMMSYNITQEAILGSSDFTSSSVFKGWEDNSNELKYLLHLIDQKEWLFHMIDAHNSDPIAHPLTEDQVQSMLGSLVRTFAPLEDKLKELNDKHVLSQTPVTSSTITDTASAPKSVTDSSDDDSAWLANVKKITSDIDKKYSSMYEGKTLNKHEYPKLCKALKRAEHNKKKLTELNKTLSI